MRLPLASLLAMAIWALEAGVATAQVVDCVRDGYVFAAPGMTQLCGPLKSIGQLRDDSRPNINVSANYALFDPPRTSGERRYNDWITERLEEIGLTGSLDVPAAVRVDNTVASSLYRSPKLMSATMSGWLCCGAHGEVWSRSMNIDPGTGRDVKLAELVDVGQVADICWQQFAAANGPLEKQGEEFRGRYPRQNFMGAMPDGRGWSVGQSGLTVFFGYLLAYVGAEHTCVVSNDALKRVARPGIAVPF